MYLSDLIKKENYTIYLGMKKNYIQFPTTSRKVLLNLNSFFSIFFHAINKLHIVGENLKVRMVILRFTLSNFLFPLTSICVVIRFMSLFFWYQLRRKSRDYCKLI